MKDCTATIISRAEASEAQLVVMGRKNKALRDSVELKKRTRAGSTIKNLGSHTLATQAILDKAVAGVTVLPELLRIVG